jgi:hypothetical protein
MKDLFEGKEISNLDPTKLFRATNETLSYMFPTSKLLFGTLLLKDDV